MRRLVLLLTVALVTATAAPVTSATPGLTIAQGHRAISAWFADHWSPLLKVGAMVDWNVSRCFRQSSRQVQCRFSLVVEGSAAGGLCFGNIRATARTGRPPKVRVVSIACQPR